MTQIKAILDEYGVIFEAHKRLPEGYLGDFLAALAELEDNECHRTKTFPRTRLHRVAGIEQPVYRADVDKISGWRIHLQYTDGQIHLKDIIEPQKHDDAIEVILSKKSRYRGRQG